MDAVDQQIIRRIRNSPLSLTIVHAPTRQTLSGASPLTAPVSPLTGAAPTTTVLNDGSATAYAADLTIQCLWMDDASVLGDSAFNRIKVEQMGWNTNATALARVLIEDAAEDAAKPYGATKFDGADFVTFGGREYKVISVQPFSSGSKVPVTYHVWLNGGA